jgi:hypothetical protein
LTNDDFLTSGDDEKHCDDCEFDGTSIFINENYSDALDWLGPDGDFDPWEAAYHFGRLTHPAQDFYSHSNWVELVAPGIDVRTADLYDLSGAPDGVFQHWFQPSTIATFVRHDVDGIDIRLDHDDMGALPFHWSVDANGGGTHVPFLKDENGVVQAKLLNSGRSTEWTGLFSDEECDIWAFDSLYVPTPGVPGPGVFVGIRQVRLWAGFTHDELNKDGPSPGGSHHLHPEARALAVLQTSYEWCRLVYKAGLEGVDGLLLALWVSPDGSPHPPNTPFAAATNPSPSDPTRGLKEITVTVESVKVLHSGDSDNHEPGEVNLSLVVYDSPYDFHRSVRSEVGPINVNSGEFVPAVDLPAPLTLCLDSSDLGFTVALHGWDDDDETAVGVGDYDGTFSGIITEDADEVLLGFQQRFLANTSGGTGTVVSRDLEVVYRVEVNTDRDGDGLGDCDERSAGTDVADADTDDDGLTDGDEVNTHGTNPLVADSDDDGLGDGTEVALGTDPLDSDSDDDGLLDDVEVATDSNPLDPDSDDDGILDGHDVEFIQNVINGLPVGAFKNGAPGQRDALNAHLNAVEKMIQSGQIAQAVRKLQDLRADLDGCGATAAQGDVIVDCTAQIQVRGYVDLLIGNLNGIAPLGKMTVEDGVAAVRGLTVLGNPARGEITFQFQLEREGECTLEVFDIRGRRVDELRLGRHGAGVHTATWDPSRLSLGSGIYFARLCSGAANQGVRFVVAR